MDRKVLPKTIHGVRLTRTQEVAREVILNMIRGTYSPCIYLHTFKVAREVANRLPGSGDITSGIVAAVYSLLETLVEKGVCKMVREGKRTYGRGLSRRCVFVCDRDRLLNFLLGYDYESTPWECRVEE